MNFKRNGCSDSDINKNENHKRNSENQPNKLFNSVNVNGFNTSRGPISIKDAMIQNNNYDGMAKSKLKLMNSDSPIKLKIKKELDMQSPEMNLIHEQFESKTINMDVNKDLNNFENSQISEERNSMGNGFETSEELIFNKENK